MKFNLPGKKRTKRREDAKPIVISERTKKRHYCVGCQETIEPLIGGEHEIILADGTIQYLCMKCYLEYIHEYEGKTICIRCQYLADEMYRVKKQDLCVRCICDLLKKDKIASKNLTSYFMCKNELIRKEAIKSYKRQKGDNSDE